MTDLESKVQSPKSKITPFGLHGPLSVLVAGLLGALTSSTYNTMIAIALPSIGQGFGVDLTVVQWVVLAYLLTSSSTIAISGRLADLLGARRTYRLGLGLFIVGGLACAMAPSLALLLAIRVIQALGTSMYNVALPTLLSQSFPREQRGRVIGLHATAVFVGLSVGPSLGGVITDLFGWRGVFVATVSIASIALVLALTYIPLGPRGAGTATFDLPGSVTYVATFVPLLLAMTQARVWGPASPQVLGLLAVGALAGWLFVRVELRASAPVIDLRLFSNRYVILSALASTGTFVAYYPAALLIPFYLVQTRGVSPSIAGLLLTAYPVTMTLVAATAGLLSDRFSPTLPASLGAVLLGGGLVVLAQVGAETSYAYVLVGLALVGAGAGCGDVSNNAALMGALPPSRLGTAAGTVATTRYGGQSVGVAMASAVFTLAAGPQVGPNSSPGFTAAFLAAAAVAGLSLCASVARGPRPK